MDTTIYFRIREKLRLVSDCFLFVLEPLQHPFKYDAGQFLTFLFKVQGREIRRSYSLCTCPSVDALPAILVKWVDNGEISRYLHDNVNEGDILQSLPPAGRFVLEEDEERDIFLLGAGSGIAPLFGLLKKSLSGSVSQSTHLLYSSRNVEETVFYNQIENLKVLYTEKLSVDYFFSDSKNLYRARLHRTLLEELILSHCQYGLEKALFYICGPYEYMQMASIVITSLGVPRNNIRKEIFVPENLQREKFELADKRPKKVKILRGGQSFELVVPHNRSILDTALENQVALPYNCRAGKCSACMGKCISGKVVMSYNEVLTEKDEQKGLVLTCTAHPLTDDVVIEI